MDKLQNLLDSNEEILEKTIAMSIQALLLIITIILVKFILNLNNDQYVSELTITEDSGENSTKELKNIPFKIKLKNVLVLIVPIILMIIYQLVFDSEMYKEVRSSTLELLYQTRIKDKNLTDFEYTKLSYEFLLFMLPSRLFIAYCKKMIIPLIVVMILISLLMK